MIEAFLARLREQPDAEAIAWRDRVATYRALGAELDAATARLDAEGVAAGEVVGLRGNYSPRTIALMLALAARGAIVVPISPAAMVESEDLFDIAEPERVIDVDGDDDVRFARRGPRSGHALYATLRARPAPGLVLFSSGSTGKPKGIVHDLARLLEKFLVRRPTLRTLTFLLFDHIGGVNTLFHTLSNGGLVVVPPDQTADVVARAIERHRVELLPTSPTFLNLALVSGVLERHDLSSLRLVTYGTEPMPESTLARLAEAMPAVKLQQTYGTSELGILRSQSPDRASLWVRLGGEGFEVKVVDGTLRVRARSAMLGYLNAPSPFDADGWLDTGDEVEQDGEFFLIKGRTSERINVGGQKVHPSEVESVIALLDNVVDVTVRPEPHPILGQVVAARVNLATAEDPAAFRKRLRAFCGERLASFKVPVKVEIVTDEQFNARMKRVRR
jgi:acyl-coenzyme A synthetase/AMP-(fatty) acid ligase